MLWLLPVLCLFSGLTFADSSNDSPNIRPCTRTTECCSGEIEAKVFQVEKGGKYSPAGITPGKDVCTVSEHGDSDHTKEENHVVTYTPSEISLDKAGEFDVDVNCDKGCNKSVSLKVIELTYKFEPDRSEFLLGEAVKINFYVDGKVIKEDVVDTSKISKVKDDNIILCKYNYGSESLSILAKCSIIKIELCIGVNTTWEEPSKVPDFFYGHANLGIRSYSPGESKVNVIDNFFGLHPADVNEIKNKRISVSGVIVGFEEVDGYIMKDSHGSYSYTFEDYDKAKAFEKFCAEKKLPEVDKYDLDDYNCVDYFLKIVDNYLHKKDNLELRKRNLQGSVTSWGMTFDYNLNVRLPEDLGNELQNNKLFN